MPEHVDPWFNELGLAYAKAFVEIETARKEYDRQMQVILGHLVLLAESAMRELKLPEALRETEGHWEYFYFRGNYAALRERRGRNPERASGFGFGFGRDGAFAREAPYGFGAYLLFNISSKRFKTFPFAEVSAELSRAIQDSLGPEGPRTPHAFEDGYGWFRVAWITDVSDHSESESVQDSVRSLPALWQICDRLMAEAYERRWPSEGNE